MKMEAEVLERLREAESILGTEFTETFLQDAAPEGRLNWLRSTRAILRANGIEVENLRGRWRTK